jgi:hypothetical protein
MNKSRGGVGWDRDDCVFILCLSSWEWGGFDFRED